MFYFSSSYILKVGLRSLNSSGTVYACIFATAFFALYVPALDQRIRRLIPGGSSVAAPRCAGGTGDGNLLQQRGETVSQAGTGEGAAGDHVARAPGLATSDGDRVGAPAEVVGGESRSIGLVGEQQQRKARSAAGQRVVAQQ